MIARVLFGIMAVCSLTLVSANDDLTDVKCIVNKNKEASKDASAKHLDGEVYFCCKGCVAKFEKSPKKYATKANHQLVISGQYVQKGCPMSGNPVKDGLTAKVGGTEVGFCCGGCKGKVDKAADLAAKADLVFSVDAFKKAFAKVKKEEGGNDGAKGITGDDGDDGDDGDEEVKINLKDIKCMMMPKKGVKEEQAADYRKAKVFFCCKGCKGKFNKDPSKFAVQANQQLFASGQFKQTGCPFSGKPIDKDKMVKVNGVKVGVCCDHCKAKVEGAADDKARSELLFSDKAFEKGFAKK